MIFYGINPVIEALRAQISIERIYIQQGKNNPRIQDIRSQATESGIKIQEPPRLERLCNTSQHQGVAAETNAPLSRELDEKALVEGGKFILFDGICDPHNFGAALRVCDVFGFPNIIYFKGNSSGLTAAAIKVSAGAAFHLNLFTCNINRAIKRLQQVGCAIYALEADGDVGLYDFTPQEPFCLVLGSEGKGVRFNIRREADHIVSIPMHGRVNSLNVSCALSATLCELARRTI